MTVNESFADRAADFAPLVSLLLVFIAIFTQQRAARLRTLWHATPTRAEAGRAAALTLVLALGTSLVLLTGMRLWLDALDDLSLLPNDGEHAAKTLFFLTWLFLGALVLWQLYLVWDAITLYRGRPR